MVEAGEAISQRAEEGEAVTLAEDSITITLSGGGLAALVFVTIIVAAALTIVLVSWKQ